MTAGFEASWGRDGAASKHWGSQEIVGAALALGLALREKPKPTSEEQLAIIAADFLGASVTMAAGPAWPAFAVAGCQVLFEDAIARIRTGERPPPMRSYELGVPELAPTTLQIEYLLIALARAVVSARGSFPDHVAAALIIAGSVANATFAEEGKASS